MLRALRSVVRLGMGTSGGPMVLDFRFWKAGGEALTTDGPIR